MVIQTSNFIIKTLHFFKLYTVIATKVRNIWELGEFSKVQQFQNVQNADKSLIR